MKLKTWDLIETEVAELVVARSMPFGKAIGFVCRNHLEDNVDQLLLACVSFCVHYDESLSTASNEMAESLERYRSVAALAADTAALSNRKRKCKDLVDHWFQTEDDFFS